MVNKHTKFFLYVNLLNKCITRSKSRWGLNHVDKILNSCEIDNWTRNIIGCLNQMGIFLESVMIWALRCGSWLQRLSRYPSFIHTKTLFRPVFWCCVPSSLQVKSQNHNTVRAFITETTQASTEMEGGVSLHLNSRKCHLVGISPRISGAIW